MAKASEQKAASTGTKKKAAAPAIQWNTANLHSSYANFCNANSTREEVVLNFGINHNWELAASPLAIELNHRVVLSPFAAKRLSELLQKLMKEYEARYGVLPQSQ